MRQGYFAGLTHAMLRRTRDGRQVIGLRWLPLLARRWYLVPDEVRSAFDRRVAQAHVASLVAVALGVQTLREPDMLSFVLFFGVMLLVVAPASQAWMTHGLAGVRLTDTELEPVERKSRQLDYARALGAPTLWGLLVVALILVLPQVYVAVSDGAWWAWLGTAMFGATAAYFGWLLLRLREDSRMPRAT